MTGTELIARIETTLRRIGVAPQRSSDEPPAWGLLHRASGRRYLLTANAGVVIVTAKVVEAAPADDEAFLRSLLGANLSLGGAFFSLEDDGAAWITQLAPLPALADEELAYLILNVGEQAARWAAELVPRPRDRDP